MINCKADEIGVWLDACHTLECKKGVHNSKKTNISDKCKTLYLTHDGA